MNKTLTLILMIANLPLFGILSSILFGKEGWSGAVRFLFIPDIISALRGELWDDWWASTMFFVWLGLCAALVWSEYRFIEEKFPEMFLYLASKWPAH